MARCVAGLLAAPGPAAFIFVITMQGHGPWECRPDAAALPAALGGLPQADRLRGYLHAMLQADGALPTLRAAVAEADGILAVYGDHQPSLEALAAAGLTGTETDYLIWDPRGGDGSRRDLAAHELGDAVCAAARPAVRPAMRPPALAPLEAGP